MFSLPPAIQALILSNVILYFAQGMVPGLTPALALWPIGSGEFAPWQLLSYAFLHGGLTHLLFNMLGLWMFGADLERVWGSRRLLVFYVVSVLGAAVAQLAVAAATGGMYPTVGASGGLFGILVGFAMMFPTRKIVPLIPPIPMPAPVFVALYGGLELFFGVTGSFAGVAHFAHLGGLAAGWLLIRYWRGQPPFPRR
ncbi:MAG TPA: rhomboid family intramembrane serine protease [Burkholderiaceae bacterium]|jgi:membrane associated rhomboid family serine protease|nr:rhomboid family intramembrane serine protease [Pseudomonadota bacterium]MDI3379910.1 rhomboid family intramembrane serine protease [Xenophilus aerolatus]HZF86250.1 rhomboid family intramembrane serine protease [Burkholderiaceae bacterium]